MKELEVDKDYFLEFKKGKATHMVCIYGEGSSYCQFDQYFFEKEDKAKEFLQSEVNNPKFSKDNAGLCFIAEIKYSVDVEPTISDYKK